MPDQPDSSTKPLSDQATGAEPQGAEPDQASLKYKDAGVDIDAGNQLVELIKPIIRKTSRPGVLGAIGGFGGLFELPWHDYKSPVLVSGTDGVGTKLKLAIATDIHDSIGIDLVAMCVNDIIVTGADPLFFLDYLATGKLDVNKCTQVIAGIAEGCVQSGAALVGGETAEMPNMYSGNDYDLAGFAVGLVEKDNIIDGRQVCSGDAIIGLASSGPHSNGYSLIHKIIENNNVDVHSPFADGDKSLAQVLLTPTKIYVQAIQYALRHGLNLKALAHITGGGLLENIPRVLPPGLNAELFQDRWVQPDVFAWIQRNGNVSSDEMFRVFNCGVGMVAVVAADDSDSAISIFKEAGEIAWQIGSIVPHTATGPVAKSDSSKAKTVIR